MNQELLRTVRLYGTPEKENVHLDEHFQKKVSLEKPFFLVIVI